LRSLAARTGRRTFTVCYTAFVRTPLLTKNVLPYITKMPEIMALLANSYF